MEELEKKLQIIQQDIGAEKLTILADSDTLTTLEKMYELIYHISNHGREITAKQFCANETLLYKIMFNIDNLTEKQRGTIYDEDHTGYGFKNWLALKDWVHDNILKLGQYDTENKKFCNSLKFKF